MHLLSPHCPRHTLTLLVLLYAAGLSPTDLHAQPSEPTDFERWELRDATADISMHRGRQALNIEYGTAYLPNVAFQDGTLEVEIAPSDSFTFAGIVFRAQSGDDSEEVYLRLPKSGLPDAVQYAPRRRGLTAWQLYSGHGFTAPARFSADTWTRLKVEVEGSRARVFVDDELVLAASLLRDAEPGGLGLWGIGATFSNFRYRTEPAATPTPAPRESLPEGAIAQWDISHVIAASSVEPAHYPGAERLATFDWVTVRSDSTGLADISRVRHIGDAGDDDGLVYARATITADESRLVRLSIGYSDEAIVFLNGRPVFAGNSRWRARDPLFLGTIGLHDHLYLPLEAGENELLVALTEQFGGWGVMAALAESSSAHP